MDAKSPSDSFTETVHVVLPNDANPLGFVLGGTVMQGYLFGRPMQLEDVLRNGGVESTAWQASRNLMFGAAS